MPAPKDPIKYKEMCEKISFAAKERMKLGTEQMKYSLANKGKKHTFDHCNKISFAAKERMKLGIERMKYSLANKGKVQSEEHTQKIFESKIGGFWYGAVTYPVVYCELFTEEFKERVRAYFGYICVECGTRQNGKRYAVHHVRYDKKTCCNGELIGDRKFIPLCEKCHPKTNSNRSYWEQYFTNMIEGYYQSKCYFTKEEYAAFTCKA